MGKVVRWLLPVVVAATVFLLTAPLGGCVQRSGGGMDPISFWKECETALGYTITIDNTRTQSKWVIGRPVESSYGKAVAMSVAAGLVVAAVTLLLPVWLRRMDDEPAYP